jgi:hypothetical protein
MGSRRDDVVRIDMPECVRAIANVDGVVRRQGNADSQGWGPTDVVGPRNRVPGADNNVPDAGSAELDVFRSGVEIQVACAGRDPVGPYGYSGRP